MSAQRTAVVTGASQGWGAAIATGLAAEGVRVVVNSRGPGAHEVADRIRRAGGVAVAVAVDAAGPEGVSALIDCAGEHYGGLDIWVNAIGSQSPEPLLGLTADSYRAIMVAQLDSVFLGSQAAARTLVAQGRGGRIITVAGGGAYGIAGASAHAATKGAVVAATYSWAAELSEYGITVNAVRGAVASPGMQRFVTGVGHVKSQPTDVLVEEELERLGFQSGDRAASLAVWLASAGASDVTGLHIGIDGSRIVVYDRVHEMLEFRRPGGWTVESIAEQVQPRLAEVPALDAWAKRIDTGE